MNKTKDILAEIEKELNREITSQIMFENLSEEDLISGDGAFFKYGYLSA
jgi:hypothetical protein